MKKLLLLLAATTFIVTNAGAQLLFQDEFSYTSGQLLAPEYSSAAGQLNVAYGYNWYNAGAATGSAAAPGIASSGLDYNNVAGYSGLQAAAGNSVAFNSTQLGSARIQVSPTLINSGNVFWSGLLQVNNVASLNSVNGALLGGFNNTPGSGTAPPTVLASALRIRQDPGDATKFDIGLAKDTGTGAGDVQWSAAQTVGTTIFVASELQINAGTANDVSSMWISPNQSDFGDLTAPTATLVSSPATADISGVETFNLRDVNTVGTSWTAQFDELKVGDTWTDVMPVAAPEPSVAVLGGLGLLALIGRFRSGRR